MTACRNNSRVTLLGALLTSALFVSGAAAARPQELERELVANLSSGRVIAAVTKDAIIIGTAETRAETGSRPPSVIELGSKRLAIMMGATEWLAPDGSAPPIRLDLEFPRLAIEANGAKHLGSTEAANDIELVGVAFLERFRVVAAQLHHKVDLRSDEPLIEIILVDYVDRYGPEVWDLRYRIAQDPMRGDFWRTRVLRPSYAQLYPPEKGQPRTLVEVRYPDDDAVPTMLQRLQQEDPQLVNIGHSDPRLSLVVQKLLSGESHKIYGADAATFMRAALPLVADPNAKLTLGVMYEEKGLDWLLAPPPLQQEDDKSRPPGAPTLRKKNPGG
jgi:hypothetical protein